MQAVRAFLQQHGDPNSASADGTTALVWAVDRDNLEIAELLIQAGANVKASNRYGVAPLSRACVYGNPAVVGLLLNAGADPNTASPEGETALMTASRSGNLEVVNSLLAHGANVNAKELWRNQTALMWAAAEGHTNVVQTLTAHGADVNARSNGRSASSTSAYRYGEGGFTALLFAARQGKLESLRALVQSGANVNDRIRLNTSEPAADGDHRPDGQYGSSALVRAIGRAHYDVASFLLEKVADPNAEAQGWKALHDITWLRIAGIGDNLPAPQPSGDLDSLDMVRNPRRSWCEYQRSNKTRGRGLPAASGENRSDLERFHSVFCLLREQQTCR